MEINKIKWSEIGMLSPTESYKLWKSGDKPKHISDKFLENDGALDFLWKLEVHHNSPSVENIFDTWLSAIFGSLMGFCYLKAAKSHAESFGSWRYCRAICHNTDYFEVCYGN